MNVLEDQMTRNAGRKQSPCMNQNISESASKKNPNPLTLTRVRAVQYPYENQMLVQEQVGVRRSLNGSPLVVQPKMIIALQ